jgi:hypothetical protein
LVVIIIHDGWLSEDPNSGGGGGTLFVLAALPSVTATSIALPAGVFMVRIITSGLLLSPSIIFTVPSLLLHGVSLRFIVVPLVATVLLLIVIMLIVLLASSLGLPRATVS